MGTGKVPRTLFVSGGMSGLGRALAALYLGRGSDVAIFDLAIDDGVMAGLAAHKLRDSQTLVAFGADVTDLEALRDAVSRAVAATGDPQLAINCAGIQRAAPFEQLPAADFERVLQVNVFGSRNFAEAVSQHLRPGARLVLVASMAGFVGNYSYAAYSASKFAVVGLGRVLRLEFKPRDISVSIICPPEVDTPMVVEESRTMHPVSRALKDLGGTLSVDQAMRGIVAGLDAGRFVIIPGFKAKCTYIFSRYLPDFVMNGLVDRIVHSVLDKMNTRPA